MVQPFLPGPLRKRLLAETAPLFKVAINREATAFKEFRCVNALVYMSEMLLKVLLSEGYSASDFQGLVMAWFAVIFVLGGEMLIGWITDAAICTFADVINGHNALQTAKPTFLRIPALFMSFPIAFPAKFIATSAGTFVFPTAILFRGSAFHPMVSN
jgi:hypothetical protein